MTICRYFDVLLHDLSSFPEALVQKDLSIQKQDVE